MENKVEYRVGSSNANADALSRLNCAEDNCFAGEGERNVGNLTLTEDNIISALTHQV